MYFGQVLFLLKILEKVRVLFMLNLVVNNALSGAWDLNSFITNATNAAKTWGGSFIMLLGAIALIVSAYQIITGLISHGKKQTNWGVSLVLLLVGGAFLAGGFGLMDTIASGGKKTIEDLGKGGAQLFVLLKSLPWF